MGALITTESIILHCGLLVVTLACKHSSTVSSSNMVLWLPRGEHTTLAMYELVVLWLPWGTLDELNGVVAAVR